MERTLLGCLAACLMASCSPALSQTVPWNYQGNDAAMQSDQSSVNHVQAAGNNAVSVDLNQNAAPSNAAIGNAAGSGVASLQATIQYDQQQAAYWQARIWVPYTYTYSCGTADEPKTCTGTSYDYDANAAQQASYYSQQAQLNSEQAQALQQQAAQNLQESQQNVQTKLQQQQEQQRNMDQAQQYLTESGNQTMSANAQNDALANQIGQQNASSAMEQGAAEMGVPLPPASAPMYTPGTMPQTVSAEGDQLRNSANAHGQSAMDLDSQGKQAYEQAQNQYQIAQEQQQKANQYMAAAAAAPTPQSAAAWRAAANAAQQQANAAKAKGDQLMAQSQQLEQQASEQNAQGVAQGQQAGQVKAQAAIENGTTYTQGELDNISAQTGVPLPPPAVPLYTPGDMPSVKPANTQLTQEQAESQNASVESTGNTSAQQEISQMMDQLGVQVPLASGQ